MNIQTLVSAVDKDCKKLISDMNLQSDAIIINQCDHYDFIQFTEMDRAVKCYCFAEKGVGLSRNNALLRANADIILFSDEDICYYDNYPETIIEAFKKNPEADMLLFNVEVEKERATYHTSQKTRIRFYNSGRYPTYSFAVKREKLHTSNITFSLLFGGGAKYSNGEDSLFLRDCLKNSFHIYALPITIGREIPRPSTWFHGYNEKFFYDRGVLYRFLYGHLAYPMALRFLWKHKGKMCVQFSAKQALELMKKGMQDAKEK